MLLDFIITLDDKFCIQAIQSVGACRRQQPVDLIGQQIDHILGAPLQAAGVIELDHVFYWYQRADGINETVLYLSNSGVLLNFYRQMFDHLTEGVQIYDRNGYFLFGNYASEQLERYDSREYQGRHLLDIYDVNEEYSTVLTILRTKQPVANRCDRFMMKNGTMLTTINSGYPLMIDNCLYGAVVFESDFSVLKQLKKRSFSLEAYVGDETPAAQNTMYTFDDIIHQADNMKEIIHFAKKVSLTDSAVLLVGATGTGKELIAQSIHAFSPRRRRPFIDVNCSAVPHNLFETIFFGTEKGAFTGSISKQGLFELANGGTLFLDEINSVTAEMQAKLLRALQEKRFQRIGGTKYIHCDVRLISAANQNLDLLMQQQTMRMDFYYRIAAIKIDLPALQDRDGDVMLLAHTFLKELCKKYHKEPLAIAAGVVDVLQQYEWPGNVRELYHVVEYAFNRAVDEAGSVTAACLPAYLQLKAGTCPMGGPNAKDGTSHDNFANSMAQSEHDLIGRVLAANHGNVTKSAQQLGMSRQSLQYRLKKLRLSRECKKS